MLRYFHYLIILIFDESRKDSALGQNHILMK